MSGSSSDSFSLGWGSGSGVGVRFCLTPSRSPRSRTWTCFRTKSLLRISILPFSVWMQDWWSGPISETICRCLRASSPCLKWSLDRLHPFQVMCQATPLPSCQFFRTQWSHHGHQMLCQGCVNSSVVEHQLRAPWTQVQLPVREPRQVEADAFLS